MRCPWGGEDTIPLRGRQGGLLASRIRCPSSNAPFESSAILRSYFPAILFASPPIPTGGVKPIDEPSTLAFSRSRPGISLRIGVVDMGSNAMRLIVAEFIAPSTWTLSYTNAIP